jgi:hypothetical protein
MKFLKSIKDFFTSFEVEGKASEEKPTLRHSLYQKELLPLSDYESRRQDIQESLEPVDGIFYLYHDEIVPDYYSECLSSDKKNPLRKKMYHMHFYPNYMVRKFNTLCYCGETSLPRGRVDETMIFIDKCFEKNETIINQLKKLYRLSGEPFILTFDEYTCPGCSRISAS